MQEYPTTHLYEALGAAWVAFSLVALPVILVSLADNEQRAGRRRFALAFLIVAAATAAAAAMKWIEPTLELPALLLWLGIYAWFGRVTVQRLNDVGRPRKLAFLLLIPYVNFALGAYLLFVRRRSPQSVGVASS